MNDEERASVGVEAADGGIVEGLTLPRADAAAPGLDRFELARAAVLGAIGRGCRRQMKIREQTGLGEKQADRALRQLRAAGRIVFSSGDGWEIAP